MTTVPPTLPLPPRVAVTADQLLSGGDNPFRRVDLPITVDGEPACVYVRPLSAGAAMRFASIKEGDPRREEALFTLIAQSVVNDAGVPLFDSDGAEKLRDVDVEIFNLLAAAITGSGKDEEGED